MVLESQTHRKQSPKSKFALNRLCINTSFVVFLLQTPLMIDSNLALEQFLEIIGGRKTPIREDNYPLLFHQHPVLKNISCIGPCFFIIADLYTLETIKVSEGSTQVIGYHPEEIKEIGGNFTFQIVHPEDLPACMQLLKVAWEFVAQLPTDLKHTHICNFYYRVIKKNGTVIKAQLQVVNVEKDLDENILVTANFITDITHLSLSSEVKLTIVDTNTNTCLSATALQTNLYKVPPILTKREVEILRMFIKGYSSRKIAEELVISYYTVRTHRKNILEKFGKKNTAELVSYALYNGLI